MKGITIYRRDFTRPMTKEEEQLAKKYYVDEFRLSTPFRLTEIAAIPGHKMIKEEAGNER